MEEQSPIGPKIRVFLISNPSMFGKGIENLLSREPTLEIVGCEEASEQVVQHIKQLSPDAAIIIGEESSMDVCRILRETAGIKVIGLNLERNTILVFHGEQRLVREFQDLLLALE